MNPNIPTCLQAPDCEHGHSEVLSGDAVHLKAKQESTALQVQSMVTQLKCESFGPHKFGEQGKDFTGPFRGSLVVQYRVVKTVDSGTKLPGLEFKQCYLEAV